MIPTQRAAQELPDRTGPAVASVLMAFSFTSKLAYTHLDSTIDDRNAPNQRRSEESRIPIAFSLKALMTDDRYDGRRNRLTNGLGSHE